ncbi:hypothetical protein T492DRAFT_354230 [Pavlovales sp. CCMP2436]|nr:hypothetical protein T492DRAFT_354230 [Pavlovales sp. CCMP2436]
MPQRHFGVDHIGGGQQAAVDVPRPDLATRLIHVHTDAEEDRHGLHRQEALGHSKGFRLPLLRMAGAEFESTGAHVCVVFSGSTLVSRAMICSRGTGEAGCNGYVPAHRPRLVCLLSSCCLRAMCLSACCRPACSAHTHTTCYPPHAILQAASR